MEERAFLEKGSSRGTTDIWWERGARETVEGWRVKKGNERGPLSLPLCFSRGTSLSSSLGKSSIEGKVGQRGTNETIRTQDRAEGGRWSGGGRRGGWRGGSKVGMRMMFPLQRWPLRIFVWYRDVCWEERVFNREAWKRKYGGFDENGTVSYLGYMDL